MKVLVAALVLVAVMLAASACASSHPSSEAPPMPGTIPSTAAQRAIARVQTSEGQGFGFFPNDEVRSGCRIPGPLGPGIKGTCQPRVSFKSRSRAAVVTFAESWPSQRFRTGGSSRRTLHHAWSFEVKNSGQVVSLGSHGDFPPQWAE